MTSRVLVLGATGGVGRKVCELGAQRGLRITAFVRSPHKLAPIAQRIRVVQGDPLDSAALQRVAADHDAVISTLGPPGFQPTTVISAGMRSLVSALERSPERRVLLVSAAILFPDLGVLAALLRATFLRHIATDSHAAEAILAESSLAWTVVRPPRLTHGPLSERWQITPDQLPPGLPRSVSRADVADCVLDQLDRREHVRRILGVAGPAR